ncbi:hypothetical protein AB0425_25875 [Actinosynnema sp. NPDC051121]
MIDAKGEIESALIDRICTEHLGDRFGRIGSLNAQSLYLTTH